MAGERRAAKTIHALSESLIGGFAVLAGDAREDEAESVAEAVCKVAPHAASPSPPPLRWLRNLLDRGDGGGRGDGLSLTDEATSRGTVYRIGSLSAPLHAEILVDRSPLGTWLLFSVRREDAALFVFNAAADDLAPRRAGEGDASPEGGDGS
ncbi:MAG: hypothetical protein LBR80_04655 [Deltaproteobacteria bacterium]|jgi:hypothetical protein|nr:hypothetical protein [Deltaproteobacteria bacterium]